MPCKSNIVFKDYSPKQNLLFPPNLEELISENHPVRVVNRIIDGINIDGLLSSYKGGGTSSYHPRMLLKVIIYAYLRNIYSSRNIEDALKENIHFMWLSGMSRPDHNTIFRFRSKRLKEQIKKIFTQVVELLVSEGQISLKEAYIDGTKIEKEKIGFCLENCAVWRIANFPSMTHRSAFAKCIYTNLKVKKLSSI